VRGTDGAIAKSGAGTAAHLVLQNATMRLPARIALAFMLSFAVAGAVQQAIMIADGAKGTASALAPLAVLVLVITAVFGTVLWRRPRSIGRAAAALLVVTLVFGVAVYVAGVAGQSPGIGGNISYLIALLVDFYFVIPAAAAVEIHWLLLRGAIRPVREAPAFLPH
jgi:hypothetical protein